MPTPLLATCRRDGSAVLFESTGAQPCKIADCLSPEYAERIAFWARLQLDAQRRGYQSLYAELQAFSAFAATVQAAYRASNDPALGMAILQLTEAGACQVRRADEPGAGVSATPQPLAAPTLPDTIEPAPAPEVSEEYEIEPQKGAAKRVRRPAVGEERFEEVKELVLAAIEAAPKRRMTFKAIADHVADAGVGPTRLRTWLPRFLVHEEDPTASEATGGRPAHFWHAARKPGLPIPLTTEEIEKHRASRPAPKTKPADDKVGAVVPSPVKPQPRLGLFGQKSEPGSGQVIRRAGKSKEGLFASLSPVRPDEMPPQQESEPAPVVQPERPAFDQTELDRLISANRLREAAAYHMRTRNSSLKVAEAAVDDRIFEITGQERIDLEAHPL